MGSLSAFFLDFYGSDNKVAILTNQFENPDKRSRKANRDANIYFHW